jgi:hypothetical protein
VLCGLLHTSHRVLLLVTRVTRWKVFLLGTQFDRGPCECGAPTDVLEVCDRFSIAKCTCRFDLLNRVSQLKEPPRSLKEVRAEICPQSVTDDRDVQVYRYRSELIDDSSTTELGFIHKDTAYPIELFPIDARVSENFHVSRLLDPYSRANDLSTKSIIKRWLNEHHLLSLATIVVCYREEVQGLRAANGAVSEVKFCHVEGLQER